MVKSFGFELDGNNVRQEIENLDLFGDNIGRSKFISFGWTGMWHERFTNLYHTQNREYDAYHERWLSPDPAGYADGLNLYAAYMGVNNIDPMGLWAWDNNWLEATLTVVPYVGWLINPKFKIDYYSNLPEKVMDFSKSTSLALVNTAASTLTFGHSKRLDPFNWLEKQTVLEGYFPARIGSEAVLAIATFGYASATKAGWLPKVALAWSTADSVIGAIQKDWIATEQALFDLFE